MARTRLPLDLARVEELARDGHTEANIARLLGVSQDTITRRKQDSADFADAMERGRQAAHSEVNNALFRQAKRGNVAAIVWYEKTRRGFTDRVLQELTGADGGPVQVQQVTADDLAQARARALEYERSLLAPEPTP
jgi:hypothetical protein